MFESIWDSYQSPPVNDKNKGKLSLDLKKKSSLEVIIMRLKVILRYKVEYWDTWKQKSNSQPSVWFLQFSLPQKKKMDGEYIEDYFKSSLKRLMMQHFTGLLIHT